MTQTARPDRQAPGIHHKAVGDILVTALNDGMFEGSFAMLAAFETGTAEQMHRERFRAIPPRLAVNSFLVQTSDRTILVDSGCGGVFGPDLGKLAGNLAALGIKPGDVDTVLCTHLHPDHVGGLVDGAGKAVFPNAARMASASPVAIRRVYQERPPGNTKRLNSSRLMRAAFKSHLKDACLCALLGWYLINFLACKQMQNIRN